MHHIEKDMYSYHMYKEGMEGVSLIKEDSEEKKEDSDDEDN